MCTPRCSQGNFLCFTEQYRRGSLFPFPRLRKITRTRRGRGYTESNARVSVSFVGSFLCSFFVVHDMYKNLLYCSTFSESYPGWQNRAFTKTLLPMLPPRFSTMIGEWAWNPWQWGDVTDVMPSRKRLREDRVTEQDQLPSSSLP